MQPNLQSVPYLLLFPPGIESTRLRRFLKFSIAQAFELFSRYFHGLYSLRRSLLLWLCVWVCSRGSTVGGT